MNFNILLAFLTDLRPVYDESSKICFSIGNFTVAWYAVIIMSGAIISAIFGYFYYAKGLGLSSDNVCEGVALGILFGVLGARLYYVAFSGVHYDSFLDVINPRGGGLAIHGVVIALAIFLPIWCKIRHVKLITLIEIVMPLVMFSQAVGRWGNFVNQEAFGALIKYPGYVNATTPLTDANLIAQRAFLSKLCIPDFIINRMYISWSDASGFTVAGYYHPTFLYESFFNFIGFGLWLVLRRFVKKIYVGDGACFYLVWYGVLRYFIEGSRTDPLMIGPFKQAQLISIFMVILGLTLFILRRVFKYKLIPCYEALKGKDSSIMLEGYETPNVEEKKKAKKEKVVKEETLKEDNNEEANNGDVGEK